MGLFSRLLGARRAAKATPRTAASTPTPASPRAPAPPRAAVQPAPAAPPANRPSEPAPPAPPAAQGLVAFFTEDHRVIDAVWADVEAAADLPGAVEAARRFDAALRRHLAWEEDELFPAFEEATGHHGFGPTHIMRAHHVQMRDFLDQMHRCATEGDRAGLNEQGHALMVLMEQHNSKEEAMLYPMADQALGDKAWQAMAARLR